MSPMSTRHAKAMLIAGLFGFSALAQAAQLYSVTDLGTLPGSLGSAGYGINDNGQAIAVAYMGPGGTRGFSYDNGVRTDLGTLGGASTAPTGINNNGQIIGGSTQAGGFNMHAFVYANGSMQDLGTLPGSGPFTMSTAYGINNGGQIVGYSTVGSSGTHAFSYSNGTMTDLGTLGGSANYSVAQAVNEAGTVVGYSTINSISTLRHAFSYSGGVMQDLGTLGGASSYAYGINSQGQIVGHSNFNATGTYHAFLYENGEMVDLTPLDAKDSYANDINDDGLIVGNFVRKGAQHGYVYMDGAVKDLNNLIDPTLGWTITDAVDINEEGDIVVFGNKAGVGSRALVLNFLGRNDVPEPSSLALAGVALAALVRRKKKAA